MKLFNLLSKTVVFLTLFFNTILYAEQSITNGTLSSLSIKEKEFIKNTPKLILGTGLSWAPYSMKNDNGTIIGFNSDILKEIKKLTGLDLELKLGPWDEIQKEAKEKKIDGLMTLIKTKDREKYLSFSKPYKNVYTYAYVNLNSDIENMFSDKIKSISIQKANMSDIKLVNKYFLDKKIIKTDSPLQNYKNVYDKKADITFGPQSTYQTALENGLPKLKNIGTVGDPIKIHIAVDKKYSEAIDIINKALVEMKASNKIDLLNQKWFGSFDTDVKTNKIFLTKEELNYLKNKKSIKVVASKNFEPHIYKMSDGSYQGLYPDLYNEVAKLLNIKIEYRAYDRNNTLNSLKSKKVDHIPAISKKLAKDIGFLTTPTFQNIIFSIFSNKERESIDSLKGLKVAYNGNIKILSKYLIKYESLINFVKTKTNLGALNLLESKEVDAVISFQTDIFFINKYNLQNITHRTTINEFQLEVTGATHKDNPLLQSILEKAITNFPINKKKQIFKKWYGIDNFLKTELSQKEKDYLSQNSFNICPRVNHYPLSGVKDGKLIGISADVLSLLNDKLNLNTKIIKLNKQEELYENIDNNTCDIVITMKYKQDKFKNLITTEPILRTSYLSIGIYKSQYLDHFTDYSKHTFYVKEEFHKTVLLKKYPDLNIKVLKDIDEIMDIIKDDANSHFLNVGIISKYYVEKYGHDKYKINGNFKLLNIKGAIAVNEAHPLLLSSLNKIILAKKDDIKNLVDQNIQSNYVELKDYTYLWYIVVGFIFIIFTIVLYYQRRLSINFKNQNMLLEEKVKLRTKELNIKNRELEYLNEDLNEAKNELENVNINLEEQAIQLEEAYESLNENRAELEVMNENLNDEVDKITKDNFKQQQIIQEQSKLAAMGEMISAIAHNWRQPLNEIGIRVQKMKFDYKDNKIDEEYILKFIKDNKNTINFLSQTIDDFRTFFIKDKVMKNFDIKNTVEKVLKLFEAQLKNHGITVKLQGDSFNIFGMESELEQVFLNLIKNANDQLYEIQPQNATITITIESRTKSIFFEDNGGGVEAKIMNRVFEPYFTTKDQGKGTGIGLYMSKMIINQSFKGDIKLTNTKNGAKFKIDLGII